MNNETCCICGNFLNFPTSEGVDYQDQHLTSLEKVLKPEVFAYVKQQAANSIPSAKCGHDILRGLDLLGTVWDYIDANGL